MMPFSLPDIKVRIFSNCCGGANKPENISINGNDNSSIGHEKDNFKKTKSQEETDQ
jgi:hypothetical protein